MSKELKKGCVVFMKASSGLTGYGNAQCVSEVHHESLGTISLYGHNQHYKTYDIDKIVEYPGEELEAENEGLKKLLEQAVCPNCDGSGGISHQVSERRYVARDMAIDAGDTSLEGS
ncbi:MAG TPA: hypothetical protein VMV58_01055, partial [Desulfosporosinus sp.]|nr:hypothetical protein [Desulfosporosinus sp.]